MQKYPFIQCPVCDERVNSKEVTMKRKRMKCPSCQVASEASLWYAMKSRGKGSRDYWPDTEILPESNTIQKKESGTEVKWSIPKQRGSWSKFLFPALWLAFITVFTCILFTIKGQDNELLAMKLFTLPFWAIGFVMLYLALKSYNAINEVVINNRGVVHTNLLFGRKVTCEFGLDSSLKIEQHSSYSVNDVPIYGVKIHSSKGVVKFGVGLSDPEKAWLVADLNKHLSLVKNPEKKVRHSIAKDNAETQSFEKNAVLERRSQEPFSVRIAAPKLSTILGGALLVFLFLGGFAFLINLKMPLFSKEGAPFTFIISIITGVAVYGVYQTLKNYGVTYLVNGTKERVEIRTEKKGLKRTVESLDRDDVLEAKFILNTANERDQQVTGMSYGHLVLRTTTGIVFVTKNRQYKHLKHAVEEVNKALS